MARTMESRLPSTVQHVCSVKDGRVSPASGQSSALLTMVLKDHAVIVYHAAWIPVVDQVADMQT